MYTYYQQNKNRINRISKELSSGLINYKDTFYIRRPCTIRIKNTSLEVHNVNITVMCYPKQVKIIESGNKIYWCYQIKDSSVTKIKPSCIRGNTLRGNTLSIGEIIKIIAHDLCELFLNDKIPSYKKPFLRNGNDTEVLQLIQGSENYNHADSETKEEIIEFSDLYRLIIETLEEVVNSKISVERYSGILKSIKDINLFPLIWYNINEGTYNVQTWKNFHSKPSISNRETISSEEFDKGLKNHIIDYIGCNNLNNWGRLVIDCASIPWMHNIIS